MKRQVRRNKERFPGDFMFELSQEEYQSLRSQIGTIKRGQHAKYLPYAFTEQGVAMLSSVVSSERAIMANIAIMRTFVNLRNLMLTNHEFADKLKELELMTKTKNKKQDKKIQAIFEVIKLLIKQKNVFRKPIGY